MATLGFGFGFGARDEGMEGAMTNAQKNLDTLNDMLEDQGKAAESSGGKISQMFDAIRTVQLGGIAGQISQILDAGNNLTTSMEQQFAQLSTSAAPFAAQLGLTGREAQRTTGKIAGLAFAMNVGPESVGKAMLAVKQGGAAANEILKEMGVSTKNLVEAERSLGIETDKFVAMQVDLNQSWDVSAKKIAEINDRTFAMAAETGRAGQAATTMAAAMDVLNKEMAASGKALSELEIQRNIEGTEALAGAFTRLGVSASDAGGKAVKVLEALRHEEVNQRKMMAGLGGEFGDFFTGIAREVNIGNIEKLFEMDPAQAVKALTDMRTAIKSQVDAGKVSTAALTRFDDTIAKVDDSLAFLVGKGQKTKDTLDAISKSAEGSEGTFKRLSKAGFRTGLTLADQFDRVQQAFETKMKRIVRKDMREFVGNFREASNEVAKDAQELAKDETWGPLLKIFTAKSSAGLPGALHVAFKEFPTLSEKLGIAEKDMDKFVVKASLASKGALSIADSLQPIFIAMGPLIPLLSKFGALLFNPVGIAVAIGAAVFIFRDEIKDFIQNQLPQLWADVKPKLIEALNIAGDFVASGLEAVANIDWKGLAQTVREGMKDARQVILDVLTFKFLDDVEIEEGSVVDRMGKAMEGIGDGLIEFFKALDVGQIFIDMLEQFGDVAKRLGDFFKNLEVDPLVDGLFNTFSQMIANINWKQVFVTLGQFAVDLAIAMFHMIVKGFELLGKMLGALIALEIQLFTDMLMGLGAALADLWNEIIVPAWSDAWMSLLTWLDENFAQPMANWWTENIENPIKAVFETIGTFFDENVKQPFNDLITFFEEIGPKVTELFTGEEGLVGTITGIGEKMMEAGKAIIQQLWDGIIEKWDEMTGWVSESLEELTDMLPSSEPKDTESPLIGLGEKGKGFLVNFLTGMQEFSETFNMGIADIMRTAAFVAVQTFEMTLTEQLTLAFGRIGEQIGTLMKDTTSEAVTQFLDYTFARIGNSLDNVSSATVMALRSKVLEIAAAEEEKAGFAAGMPIANRDTQQIISTLKQQTRAIVGGLDVLNKSVKSLRTMGGGNRKTDTAPGPKSTGTAVGG